MRAISIRLDSRLGKQFEKVCQETGYKKTTLLTRLIASFVRHHQSRRLERHRKKRDPFLSVVGLLETDSLLNSADTIDKAVYDL